MARKKREVESLAEQGYQQVLLDFVEERGTLAEAYTAARKRADNKQAHEI
jgi:hypothetical protein